MKMIKNLKNLRKTFIKSLYAKKTGKPLCGVYKITCTKNDSFYIGSSRSILKRWEVHKFDLTHNCHDNYRLQTDYHKFGLDFFIFEVLHNAEKLLPSAILFDIEQDFVDRLKPDYNIRLDISLSKKPVKKKSKIIPYKDPTFPIAEYVPKSAQNKEKKKKLSKKQIKALVKKLNAPPKPGGPGRGRNRRRNLNKRIQKRYWK